MQTNKPYRLRMKAGHLLIKGFCLMLFIIAGCEKEVDIHLTGSGGKPVVYSFIQPDSSFRISLSQSVDVLNAANAAPLRNAYVQILKNNIIYRTLSFNSNAMWNQYNDVTFSAGDSVKINILDDQTEIASCLTYIPKLISIIDTDTIKEFRTGEDGFIAEHINLKVRFTDPLDTADYYQIMIIENTLKSLTDKDTLIIDTLTIPKTDLFVFNNSMGISNLGNIDFQGLFTDKNIDGTTHRLQMSFPATTFRKAADDKSKTYEIRLYHLSEDYYNYFRAQIISTSFEGLPIFEPVKFPSNVTNGYGLVTGLTLSKVTLEVK